jgi:hypothetical protein
MGLDMYAYKTKEFVDDDQDKNRRSKGNWILEKTQPTSWLV